MKDQLMAIADALEHAYEDWICSFQINKTIGDYVYKILISSHGNKLELTTKLPGYISEDMRAEWVNKIAQANEHIDCGAFALCNNGRSVCYQVYSLYTQADEVKGEETVNMLLNSCYAALESQAAALIVLAEKKGLIEGFFNLIGLVKDSEVENDEDTITIK